MHACGVGEKVRCMWGGGESEMHVGWGRNMHSAHVGRCGFLHIYKVAHVVNFISLHMYTLCGISTYVRYSLVAFKSVYTAVCINSNVYTAYMCMYIHLHLLQVCTCMYVGIHDVFMCDMFFSMLICACFVHRWSVSLGVCADEPRINF